MYYQEKWIGEELFFKTTPNGKWTKKALTLLDIADGINRGSLSIERGLDLAFLKGQQCVN